MLTLTNEYEPNANNGNLKSQTIAPVNMKQSYFYDARNRLGSASEQPSGGGAVTWSQSFGFDDFGNNWVSVQSGALPGGGPRPNQASWYQMPGTSGTVVNNRIAGEQYDAAGNQTSLGALTAEYDGEGRIKLIRSGSQTVASFAYDALGQRVRAVRDGVSTVMVYDALGRLSAEYEAGVAGPLQPRYLTMDQLGSVRMATDGAGNVLRRADYLPFGEEIPAGLGGRTLAGYGQAGPRQRFTGQERETESGVDYFKARYFNGAQGRFTGADAPFADQSAGDPGSWNLFAYARNNPLRWVDPSGRCSKTGDSSYVDSDTDGALIFKGPCRNGTIGGNDGGKPMDEDRLSPYAQGLYNAMSERRVASNQIIAAFSVGSAAVGVTGGVATAYHGAVSGSGLTTLGLRSGHGAFRLAVRGFSEADIALTKTGNVLRQTDGAKVYIKELGGGKFNFIVEGEHGVVTAIKNISQKSLERLATRYGWK
ncbi:MAG: RHS repeat-associated core domain-containing protein [Acidobacteria bacterium]|nr:RHS repeat-associated core domain-containing protein [Acidobacteriota bacterium]